MNIQEGFPYFNYMLNNYLDLNCMIHIGLSILDLYINILNNKSNIIILPYTQSFEG